MGSSLPTIASSAPVAAGGLTALAGASVAAAGGLGAAAPGLSALAAGGAGAAAGTLTAAAALLTLVAGASAARSASSSAAAALKGVGSAASTMASQVSSNANKATAAINNMVSSMQSAVNNMQLRIPQIQVAPLPHFSMSGSFNPETGAVPSVSVSWYGSGGFFNRASLIGVGEAGPEVNIPLAGRKMQPFAKAVALNLDNQSTKDYDGSQVIEWLAMNLPTIIETCTPVIGENDFNRRARKAVQYA